MYKTYTHKKKLTFYKLINKTFLNSIAEVKKKN